MVDFLDSFIIPFPKLTVDGKLYSCSTYFALAMHVCGENTLQIFDTFDIIQALLSVSVPFSCPPRSRLMGSGWWVFRSWWGNSWDHSQCDRHFPKHIPRHTHWTSTILGHGDGDVSSLQPATMPVYPSGVAARPSWSTSNDVGNSVTSILGLREKHPWRGVILEGILGATILWRPHLSLSLYIYTFFFPYM